MWVRFPPGAQKAIKPPTDNVERFLSMLRFENKGKLEELPNFNLNLR
jgi:hypothetical protein